VSIRRNWCLPENAARVNAFHRCKDQAATYPDQMAEGCQILDGFAAKAVQTGESSDLYIAI
jgi:hypothetical protein